jgi:release factor glutamine methyltransferase
LQLKEQLRWAVAQLTPSTTESPRLDAELLLCHLLGKSRSWLHTWPDQPLTAALEPLFRQLVERRRSGEPIAHLLGSQSFWSLDLKVTADTLIPRPDTERLIEQALLFIPEHQPWQVADLGTGTGAIAIAIATERPDCSIIATDQSLAALNVARENSQRYPSANLSFRSGSWFEPLQGEHFELILSNPPYIAEEDPHLTQGDLRFEPGNALVSGVRGMDDLQQIISTAPDHLHPNGILLVEHGYDQGKEVRSLFTENDYHTIKTRRDLGGEERITYGTQSSQDHGLQNNA